MSFVKIANKAGVSTSRVRKLVVWGESGQRALVDTTSAELFTQGRWKNASKVISDDVWLEHQLATVCIMHSSSVCDRKVYKDF